jgi:hypothetical protein
MLLGRTPAVYFLLRLLFLSLLSVRCFTLHCSGVGLHSSIVSGFCCYFFTMCILEQSVNSRIRPLSPERKKEKRDPFAPRKHPLPSQEKRKKTSKPDSWDGGGGSVYHSSSAQIVPVVPVELDSALTSKKKTDGIKRDLKGSERERELRRVFKPFAPARVSVKTAPTVEEKEETGEVVESKAFDAKRLRGIGFDPRRKANEEVKFNYMERTLVLPPRPDASEISLENMGLSKFMRGWGEGRKSRLEEVIDGSDSDSDSDLDIVME